jgi:DnaK suppressor protein
MRSILLRRREDLHRLLREELTVLCLHEFGDEGDVANETCGSEVSSRLVHSGSRELAQVETAIARLREGRFGICEECDRPISLTRLAAMPYAQLCIRCQRAAERSDADSTTQTDREMAVTNLTGKCYASLRRRAMRKCTHLLRSYLAN